MSVTVTWHSEGGVHTQPLRSPADVPENATAWIDVVGRDGEVVRALAARFGMHPLNIEDALHTQIRPKIDVYDDGAFFTWLVPVGPDGAMREVDIFVTSSVLITVRDDQAWSAFDVVGSRVEQLLPKGPFRVLHALLDELIDSVLPVADAIANDMDELEECILEGARAQYRSTLYGHRRHLLSMHRIVVAEIDVVRDIQRLSIEGDGADLHLYYGDLIDHLLSARESIETYREISASLMDIYLSAQSNSLNEIMKVLTATTVIIGVLTLVSGVYGMNLLHGMWPSPDSAYAFFGVVAAMGVIALVLSYVFRRWNWW